MAVIAVGSARWLAQQAERATQAPPCAIDTISHALVSADDSLIAATAIAGDRIEAERWVRAADRDLGALADRRRLRKALRAPLEDARAAVMRSLAAPDACFEHAITAARRSISNAAIAGGRSLDDARAGATACTHPPIDRTLLPPIAESATATRTFLASADHATDPVMIQEASKARYPDRAVDDVHRATARQVRDELASTFDPLVHDLLEHTRELRNVPIERMRRSSFALRVAEPPGRAITSLEYGLPIPESGEVDRVAALVREIRPKSGNGAQIDLPVGEYGEPMAMAQAKAAQAMHEVILERLDAEAKAIGRARRPMLQAWTFQKDNVTAAMLEGVTSIAQATAIATQRRVPGMDEYQLLDALAQSHVYDRLAKAPIGFMAPIARTGRRIDEPLAVTSNGGVRLGAELDEMYRATLADRQTTGSPAATTRAGCPLALRGRSLTLEDGSVVTYERTMLTELAREYLHLVGRYLRADTAAPTAAAT